MLGERKGERCQPKTKINILKYTGQSNVIKKVSILCLKIFITVTLLILVFEEVQLSVLLDEFHMLHS